MFKKQFRHFWENKFAVLLILVGTLTWSATVVKSGWQYDYGLGFWGANGHDGIWHIALAESLSRGSRGMPVFAGSALQNYHLGFDLLLAGINRVTQLPVSLLYFQILPPILAFLIGFLTYLFTLNWTKSKRSAFWSTFFVYFGGSFAWILGKGESAFWSQQAISTLINPPFALSLVFILLGLICWLKNKKIFSICFFSILIFIKVYAGLLVLGGLFVAGLYSWFRIRNSSFVKIFLGTLIVSSLISLSFNKISTGLLVWQPFWFFETMMQLTDRVGWAKFGEAMVNYRAGGLWFKAILAYGFAFVVFVVGNLGTRIVFIKEVLKKLDAVKVFMLAITIAGVIIPMFFLQKGTPWNTIQFFYYSLFFSGILSGIYLGSMKQKNLAFAFLAFIFLVTVPTTLITLKDVYLPSRPPAMLPKGELEALTFLSQQDQGVVLTYPFDKFKAKEAESNPPRPLYLYDSTAYVAAYSKQPVFLEDEVNLDITNYDWRTRRAEIEAWYQENNQIKAREFLNQNKIKYVYWVGPQRAYLGEGQLGLEKIFENKEVNIYVVKSI